MYASNAIAAPPASGSSSPIAIATANLPQFRGELRRRGFGTWLDSRELSIGDELTTEIQSSIRASSHLVLIWSVDCFRAEWIELETAFAENFGKRILIVRVDGTSVPSKYADSLVEAQALSATEAARLIAISLEREE